MHDETRDDARAPVLTWIGGPWPLPDGAGETFGATFHELVPGGSLRCSCGLAHDVPPPSDIIVRAGVAGPAAIWLGARRSGPIRGVVDASGAAALALHVASIAGGGFLAESFEEAVALFAPATELALGVFTSEGPVEPTDAAREWVEARSSAAVVRVLFAGDFRLRTPCDFARDVLEPHAADSMVQLLSVPGGRCEISILAAFTNREPTLR